MIQGDNFITNLEFLDLIGVTEAITTYCENISFDRTPKKVKMLVLSNCQLSNIDGIQKMNQLTELSLGLNALTDKNLKFIL